jgi:hypothetical protein
MKKFKLTVDYTVISINSTRDQRVPSPTHHHISMEEVWDEHSVVSGRLHYC